jgi:hypothetical protein
LAVDGHVAAERDVAEPGRAGPDDRRAGGQVGQRSGRDVGGDETVQRRRVDRPDPDGRSVDGRGGRPQLADAVELGPAPQRVGVPGRHRAVGVGRVVGRVDADGDEVDRVLAVEDARGVDVHTGHDHGEQ